ncbi:unnamed protein product [Penicillium salamii]|nr:unnamed protein product [Penicillium salamii]CAG8324129.1 unnamed protein product [Penicillium salamii]CAG8427845.1 unnamed protein product [Penicillium salamii]
MEGTHHIPLTVKHQSSRARLRGTILTSTSFSNLPYPRIPSRRSSLSMSTGDDSSSNGLATSTRTPSLTDSLYNIQVVKVRQDHDNQTRSIQKTKCPDISEDPFVDQTPRRCAALREQTGRGAPNLIVRWSSGSYASVDPCISPDPNSSSASRSDSMEQLPRPVSKQHEARVNSDRFSEKSFDSNLMYPLELPVTFAKIRSYAGKPCLGADYSRSLWVSVNVTADVNHIPMPEKTRLAPLDMIVLFDYPQRPSVGRLTPMMLASSILTSNLISNHDRLAVACVDGNTRTGFDLLLPLGFHSYDTTRGAFDNFFLRQLQKKQRPRTTPDLSQILRQISHLFSASHRATFGHLMLVSANPPSPDPLLISGIDRAIGVHTLSPHSRFPLDTENHPLGWHISYDEHAEDLQHKESHLTRKVAQVVRQIRTGTTPGFLSNLNLYMGLGPGCQLLSANTIDCCQLVRLRPGEAWVSKVKVGVPHLYQEAEWQFTAHPIIQDLIYQLNEVIGLYSSQQLVQHILSAGLKYQHSLLPGPHETYLESHCTIAREATFSSCSSSDDSNLELLSYEDDGSISASLGSSSEGS